MRDSTDGCTVVVSILTGEYGRLSSDEGCCVGTAPVGLAAGSDSAGIMPEDMVTVEIKLFAADVVRVDESSIFDAGLLSPGNLGVRDLRLRQLGSFQLC